MLRLVASSAGLIPRQSLDLMSEMLQVPMSSTWTLSTATSGNPRKNALSGERATQAAIRRRPLAEGDVMPDEDQHEMADTKRERWRVLPLSC